jgi:hypothetical protein
MTTILHHTNCENTDCKICYNDHIALEEELEERTGNHSVDHLGRYESFLRKNLGIKTETEWGWATQECFEEYNIQKYMDFMTE